MPEYLPNVPKCRLNTRHDNREVTHIHLTRAQTLRSDICSTGSITEAGQWLSTLFHATCMLTNCFAAQLYVLHRRQFIFAASCRRRPFLQVLQSTERQERYFEKFFVYMMRTNVMMKTCLNQKILKISNLIQAVKNSVCPKAKVMRRRNFSESRICPNIYRMFRSVDWILWLLKHYVVIHLGICQTCLFLVIMTCIN